MLTRFLKSLFPVRKPSPPYLSVTFRRDLASSGLNFEGWWQRREALPWSYVDVPQMRLGVLKTAEPKRVADCQRTADRILRHEFDLLGSGTFSPVDLRRPARPSGYRPIDWMVDPRQAACFPADFFHRDWNPATMRPGLADIKFPWELARCQHWPVLGQAYRLKGDGQYALEIRNQLEDFMEANPVGFGVNWVCTMDVAIRAINWLLGLELVKRAALSGEFWEQACEALYAHGVFIRANLENTYEVTSNHFLSNVVGLYYLSRFFEGLPRAQEWRQFARKSLETEMLAQVLDDGADFESSIPYHRLVTELFLGAARLADVSDEPLSAGYRARLLQMVEYLVGVMRPDGLMPVVGDADDGRLHILTGYGERIPQDGRHLLGPAAFMFGRPDWLACSGATGYWEAFWWGYEVKGAPGPITSPPPVCRLYANAGVAVARRDDWFLLITNSPVGTKGFGNHKHNDQLSIEYHARGVPILVDPGSYVYTSDPPARNMFRSVSYHNTLRVDGLEPNELNPDWLFRLFEQAHPVHDGFEERGEAIEYRGRQNGFRRLPDPVTHERRIRLHTPSGVLAILDILWGQGTHCVEWHFHCDPRIQVSATAGGQFRLKTERGEFLLHVPDGLIGTVSDAWYSPSYGVRRPCQAIDLKTEVQLDGRGTWFLALEPSDQEHSTEGSQPVVHLRQAMQAVLGKETVA